MPDPRTKTERKAALTGGGKKSVSKDVHHLRPIGTPHCSAVTSPHAERDGRTGGMPAPVTGSPTGSEVAATAGDSEHQRPAVEVGPLPVRRWRGATALAYEANGYKEFKVCAPRSLEAATHCIPHPTEKDETIVVPHGPDSVEYAPFHAVPGEVVRIFFDPARIGEETRRMNEQAEKDAEITDANNALLAAELAELEAQNEAQNEALYEKRTRKREEKRPRNQMGDFADDEDEWEKHPLPVQRHLQ